MGGFGVSLQTHELILLLLFLLRIQSLGLDTENHPPSEVCATHTISPGPKGEERKAQFSSLISKLSPVISQPLVSSQ